MAESHLRSARDSFLLSLHFTNELNVLDKELQQAGIHPSAGDLNSPLLFQAKMFWFNVTICSFLPI